jgi:solute carrier family 25 phosphate transporter 23/24/25/41
MTLDVLHRYKGLGDCIKTMAVQEGPSVFYRGLAPSIAAIAPEAAITYGLHDLLKRAYHKTYRKEPGIGASLLCGVVAAWSGQLVAFPLETVSRRMQLAGVTGAAAAASAAAASTAAAGSPAVAAGVGTVATAAAAAAGPNMGQVVASILKEGGPGALYRGLGATTLRLVPSAVVSFGAYELIRKLLLDLEAKQEVANCRAKHKQLHKVLSSAQKCNQVVQQLQAQGVEVPAVGPVAAAGCSACDLAKGNSEGLGLKGVPAADGRSQGSSSSTQQSVLGEVAAVAAAAPTGCQLVAAAVAASTAELPATAAGVRAAAADVDACPTVPILGDSVDCKPFK